MRVHYVLSDFLYIFIYKLFRYRIKVVRSNLSSSFPEKSADELRDIEHRFYHWFCDYLVETVKLFSISEKQIMKRMRFEGIEQMNEDMRQGHSVTVYLGHYCNWEWISSLGLHLIPEATAAQLYHPIENKVMDRLFLYARGRFHDVSLEMKEAFGILRNWQKEGRISLTGYISDQVPGFSSMHYWPWFLNHETPTYTGAERIARVLDTPVYYFDIYRPRRGYYVAKAVKICGNPKELPKFGITEQYYRLLENSIKRAPEFWLWSHNRWKRTREQFNELYPEEERKRILSKLQ
jgi:KDO2-lipid IV(A) lauroyltransferase